MFLFGPRKGVEVLDLNALKLCETWGFSGQLHIKSVLLGQNRNICGRFGGHMDIINTSTQSVRQRLRLNVSIRVPTKVTAFFLAVGSTVFEVGVED
jgi:hypothetical protein